jgi:DNA-binding response OmpR family regulator
MPARILLVEDDLFLRKLFLMNLAQPDWEISVAENGQEALTLVRAEKPDLLLLDLVMPVLDGYGVLAELRNMATDFPIIVLSNLNQETDLEKARQLGVQELFVKSTLDFETLIARIRELLQAKH